MNRFTFLFVLLTFICVTGKAQERYADIKVSLVAPVTGDVIYPDNQFDITTRIHNLGVDTLRDTDSGMYMLYFNGSPISFGNASGGYDSFLVLSGQTIVPGDSAEFSIQFTIDTSWKGGATDICVALMPYNISGNLYDTILNNNKACASVTIDNSTGVKNVASSSSSASIYPNPAKNEAYIKLNLASANEVSYRITDVTGRILLQDYKGRLQTGEHNLSVDISRLSPGTYWYQVTIGTETQNGKLVVQ